ncbi:trehalose-phosphatase [Ilumatobacter sp.]|uniref:trehalose-phosphatase n=1 Tax=Ilumatobacter sp. TaxID=1967498 RepID=UPI003C68AF7A
MTGSEAAPPFDDPIGLAETIASLDRPVLITFDCDGVLAPLTDHADDSVLTSGVGADLTLLADGDGITVAILSGRSLAGLAQFGFGDELTISGSYGAERRGLDEVELTPSEADRLRALDDLLSEAARRAGDGSWVERKPTSVVVHVREADPGLGRSALEWVRREQTAVTGHVLHEGNNVIELMARPADKGSGLEALRREFAPASTVYVGDDVPDEEAFGRLGTGDIGIKVGVGDTAATHRVRDADAIREMISALVDTVDTSDA